MTADDPSPLTVGPEQPQQWWQLYDNDTTFEDCTMNSRIVLHFTFNSGDPPINNPQLFSTNKITVQVNSMYFQKASKYGNEED